METSTGTGETPGNSTEGQSPSQSQGHQTGTQSGQGAAQQATGNTILGPDGKPFDPARAMETIQKLRGTEAEHTKLQKEFSRLQAQLKEIEDAKLTQEERTQKRLQELEQERTQWQRERQELLTKGALVDAARDAGMTRAAAVWKLADHSLIEYDEDGVPTPDSLKAAVKAVQSELPELFSSGQDAAAAAGASKTPAKPAPQSGSPINAAKGAASSGYFKESQIGNRDFYLANKAEIDAAVREGRVLAGQ